MKKTIKNLVLNVPAKVLPASVQKVIEVGNAKVILVLDEIREVISIRPVTQAQVEKFEFKSGTKTERELLKALIEFEDTAVAIIAACKEARDSLHFFNHHEITSFEEDKLLELQE